MGVSTIKENTLNEEYPKICPDATYGRVYQLGPDGPYVASVTTITSYSLPTQQYLMKWFIEQSKGDYQKHIEFSGEASEVGTAVHALAERVLRGEEVVISDDPLDYVSGKGYYPTHQTLTQIKKGLQSFMTFWNKQGPELVAMEELLWSLDRASDGTYLYPFCGRVDMVATIGDERWLLDLKTSKVVKNSLAYQLQLSAYKLLWDAKHPELPIDRLGVIHCNKTFTRDTPPKSVEEPIEYKFTPDLLFHAFSIFSEVYDGFELGQPKRKAKVPKVFSLA